MLQYNIAVFYQLFCHHMPRSVFFDFGVYQSISDAADDMPYVSLQKRITGVDTVYD